MIKRLLKLEFVRYGLAGGSLVVAEIILFAVMNSLFGISYLVATPLSTAIIIVANWYVSRQFVFAHRVHSPRKEFVLVAAFSIAGIGIQLGVAIFVVTTLHLIPIIAKIIAIGVTFFWNYWTRRKYIFPTVKLVVD